MAADRERPLTARQAAACESAKSPPERCRCRCGGAAHGKARGRVRELEEGDPHFPDDPDPKARRRALLDEEHAKRKRQLDLPFDPGAPVPLLPTRNEPCDRAAVVKLVGEGQRCTRHLGAGRLPAAEQNRNARRRK